MKVSSVAALLGVVLVLLAIYSLIEPTLCATGCGNLLEPIFQFAYFAFGAWGVRAMLCALAFLAFWGAARAANDGE